MPQQRPSPPSAFQQSNYRTGNIIHIYICGTSTYCEYLMVPFSRFHFFLIGFAPGVIQQQQEQQQRRRQQTELIRPKVNVEEYPPRTDDDDDDDEG
jgi:hypothetical protein